MDRSPKYKLVLELLESDIELTRANARLLYGVSTFFKIIKRLENQGYKIKRRKLDNAEVGYSLDKTN